MATVGILFTGVKLEMNESILMSEGGTKRICVGYSGIDLIVEREIPFLLTTFLGNFTSGKLPVLTV